MARKGQSPKQQKIRSDALMEVLRGFGGDAAKSLSDDLFKQIPKDLFNQTGLRPQSDANQSEHSEFPFSENKEWLAQRLKQTETVRYQEKIVYSSQQQETKAKVETLVLEVKKLEQAVGNLTKEVGITTAQAPVNPGVYHINFFEKLISFVRSLTKQVEDSSLWLSAHNGKSQKRSHYWNQFSKSGSKFLLSQERYMATQAG